MKLWTPHDYQVDAVKFAAARPAAGLFLDPGLGKTSISLSLVRGLMRTGLANRTLVVAPLRVCYATWPAEIAEWSQFAELRVSIVHGTPAQRLAALKVDADIYLINPEGVVWLSQQNNLDFDTLIVDESTKFKSPKVRTKKRNPKTNKFGLTRFAALKKLRPMFKRRYILTGTPMPNSFIDLWSQIYVLDGGARLGRNITAYRERFFNPGRMPGQYHLKPGAKEEIESLIADIVLVMDCRDYLDMPSLIFNDIPVLLPPKVRAAYNRLEKELFFELDVCDDSAMDEISELATNAGVKYGMARQIVNGGLYVDKTADGDRREAFTHSAKLDALEDLHEELSGKPLMAIFHYRHELNRLLKRFGDDTPVIAGGVDAKSVNRTVEAWNAGDVPLLLCQPQAMSHGLNMQHGGENQAWLGLTDDLDIYLQVIARLWRQGQKNGVRIHRILATDTIDEPMVARSDEKGQNQRSFLDALKNYRLTK